MKLRMFMLMGMVMALLSFSACGGGGNGSATAPPPTTYTIGGTVSGLSGTGLVLENNGGNNLPVSANGGFTFTTPIASGGAYNVAVASQTSGPTPCVVTNGSGTANANVTSVQVSCTLNSAISEWTWVGGSNLINQPGTYGTRGTAAASNIPGDRGASVSWKDAVGNFWLFGGTGYDATGEGEGGNFNDLWKYSAGEWTWMGGSNLINQSGTYGSQGTAASSNIPGSRQEAVSWTDAAGDFWLFGGFGCDSTGASGALNDLWKYSAGEWTWMGGSNLINQPGTYGTQGTAAPNNIPGALYGAVSWTDAAENFWLFGGLSMWGSAGASGYLNDLWKYSEGEWTWMGGSNLMNQPGTYGTQRTAAPNNIPGAREPAVSWMDAAGNLWLFGGNGYDSAGIFGDLNDLWKYSAGEWTWMGGADIANQPGTYGTQGAAAPNNIPGARYVTVGWTDAAGNLWLLGGSGLDSKGYGANLNDLWKYSAGEWTWMGGADIANQPGTYGTQGTAAATNIPGARYVPVSWTDAVGNFWLFGGDGLDSTGASGFLSDLWTYEPN